jgi:hypothetical protein
VFIYCRTLLLSLLLLLLLFFVATIAVCILDCFTSLCPIVTVFVFVIPRSLTRCKKGFISLDDRLFVRSTKILLDGALGSRGAALLAPYSDDVNNTGSKDVNVWC